MNDTPEPKRSTPLQRARATALWLRDTGLGAFGFTIVLTVALAGWAASFIGLHTFGVEHMSLTSGQAWLVPLTFDGAPAGLSIVVMRASTHGRAAIVWRLLIIGFTGLSSWINYAHIDDDLGRCVAAFMPPSAVILFEGLMSEARAAAKRSNGDKIRPTLHPLRWLFDYSGTLDLYRRYILGLPLPDAISGDILALAPVAAGASATPPGDTSSANATAVSGDSSATSGASTPPPTGDTANDSKRQEDTRTGASDTASTGDSSTTELAADRRQRQPRPVAKRKTGSRRSMTEWVELAGPVFHAEFERLRRQPTGDEFAEAIKKARLGTVSASTAKNIRAEILDRAPLPALN